MAQRLRRRDSKAGARESLTIITIVLGSLQFGFSSISDATMLERPSRRVLSGVAALQRAESSPSKNNSSPVMLAQRQAVAGWRSEASMKAIGKLPRIVSQVRSSRRAMRQIASRACNLCRKNAATYTSNPAPCSCGTRYLLFGVQVSAHEFPSWSMKVSARAISEFRQQNAENAFSQDQSPPCHKECDQGGQVSKENSGLFLSALHCVHVTLHLAFRFGLH
jgi:hypothetical protein